MFIYRIYCFRINGAIMLIMIKQITIVLVLMSLLVGNSWNIELSRQSQQRSQKISAANVAAAVADSQLSKTKVREKRFINPFNKLVSIWNALTHIYSLYVEVSIDKCFENVCKTNTHRKSHIEKSIYEIALNWLHFSNRYASHNTLFVFCLCFVVFLFSMWLSVGPKSKKTKHIMLLSRHMIS